MSTPAIVDIRAVSKIYPGAGSPAVDRVDLVVERGCIFGLLGPNGAGKTTLLSMLCGLLKTSIGTIAVDGFDVARDAGAVRKRIGFVPQDVALYPTLTARENLAYFGGIHGLSGRRLKTRIDDCLALAGLEAQAGRRIDTFSGGLKRRLHLVVALIHEPELLILDEPTVGIDPQSRRFIHENLKRLNRGGLSILCTSHYLDEVERLCDELAIIDHGRLVARGTVDEILNHSRQNDLLLRLRAPLPATVETALRALKDVRSLRLDERLIAIECAAPLQTLPVVLGRLEREGVSVISISVGATTLEQVFLALTGTQLRDEAG